MLIDTLVTAETAEGVGLELRVAGPVSRSLAWLIDSCLRAAVYIAMLMTLGLLGEFGIGLVLIGIFAVEWLYPVVFEVFNRGATPGKRALGLRVVRDNGLPVDWSASMIRNILRTVDFLPLFYALGFITMLCNRRFQRLGDLVGGTLVVYDYQGEPAVELAGMPPVTPNQPLLLEEQRAVIDFVRRAPQLSAARADEVASMLDPLFDEPSRTPRQRLMALANGLLGRKAVDP